ncbi:hypothetical protein QR680_003555 [Steinernema hermaphroditum]|uniref:Pleiotropic regulator 1 n=1 Tax=Steinernema hermaphroditum TaxID=289476 RepID=A0AA39LS64_9BILA|nr:hypothetical protein QR680_003555 [Steinernema hermaphroditum]
MTATTQEVPANPIDLLPDVVDPPSLEETPAQKTLLNTVFRSMKRSHDMFYHHYEDYPEFPDIDEHYREAKLKTEYKSLVAAVAETKRRKEEEQVNLPKNVPVIAIGGMTSESGAPLAITGPSESENDSAAAASSSQKSSNSRAVAQVPSSSKTGPQDNTVRALLPSRAPMVVKPKWHAPWKLYRVLSGHTGWVRSVDVEPGNEWLVSGGADRIIKIWDLAKGTLRLSLTGHISAVRAVKVSPRHPFIFSAGEDKQVKCWDLETNKVVRHYHGHLSAVQDLDIHPTMDLLVTCARDSTARLWDMRTKAQIHCLTGHTNTVASVRCQATDPQVITSSHDSTIRLWDIVAGRSVVTLTNHKKAVRALSLHPTLRMFASGSPDNIKQWKCPDGEFYQNLSGHNAVINSLTCNQDGVLVSGADNGTMQFWDWNSGFCFDRQTTKVQPGSIDSEAGIYSMCFDRSGSRLITAEADKTIKMYKEDDTATEESHPVMWRPNVLRKKMY